MSQYSRATEAQAMAEETVIPKYKPFLKSYDIGYVQNTGSMKSRGVEVWAKIKTCSPLEAHLSGHDILVIVNALQWGRLTRPQRIALLHHEFCHVDENDEGELVMLPHDLEEFAEVVKEHGLWRPAVDHFASQLTLALNEGVDKPRPWIDPHVTGTAEDADAVVADMVSRVTIKANGREVETTADVLEHAAEVLEEEALDAPELEVVN